MKKVRTTLQRQKILEYLKSVRTHPTAETIYLNVKKDLPSLTLATVYRNLNLLFQLGKIKRLEINSEFRFDAHTKPHQHLVCKTCGSISDLFHDLNLDNFENKVNNNGFDIHSFDLMVYGICKSCKGGK